MLTTTTTSTTTTRAVEKRGAKGVSCNYCLRTGEKREYERNHSYIETILNNTTQT